MVPLRYVRRMGLSVEDPPKPLRKVVWKAGGYKHGREPIARCAREARALDATAQRHDRNVARARVLFQVLKKPPAVVVRHRKFSDDDVRVRFPGAAAGFRAVLRGNHVESHRGEGKRIQRECVCVSIHEEDKWA